MLQSHPLFAYLPASDLARARRFYEQTLGFTPGPEVGGGVTYRFGGGTAAFLYPTENAGTSKASQAFWQYPGMEGEQSPSGVVTAGGAKAAWFKDSEGNTLAVIQDA